MTDVLYSREQVEAWQQNLEKIAQLPRTSFTKKQAVEALIKDIEAALKNRSYQEVAKTLKKDGLDITAGSLKQYVTRYRRSHSKPSRRQKNQEKAEVVKSKTLVKSDRSSEKTQKRRTTKTPAKSPQKSASAKK
ncbi:MAG: hypothetical protein AAF050_18200 [Cyanobacteria bacterium J06649_5]